MGYDTATRRTRRETVPIVAASGARRGGDCDRVARARRDDRRTGTMVRHSESGDASPRSRDGIPFPPWRRVAAMGTGDDGAQLRDHARADAPLRFPTLL